jgi:protein-tyrosine phosphatase
MKRLRAWMGLAPADDGEAVAPGATRILTVCMGNICRSPTAEGVLRAKLQRAGLGAQVVVDSAGTNGYHTGEGPDPRAVRAAAQRGYDLSRIRARPVAEADFERFDWILAMDQANLDWLRQRAPAAAHPRLSLLLSWTQPERASTLEVPDPYYGTTAGFEHVLDLVEAACDGFVARLAAQSPPGGGRGRGDTG